LQVEDRIDVGLVVHPQEVGLLGERRIVGREVQIGGVVERLDDRLQPRRTFHVAVAGTVVEHVLVGVERDGHGPSYRNFARSR
jgi:hypothetical protein